MLELAPCGTSNLLYRRNSSSDSSSGELARSLFLTRHVARRGGVQLKRRVVVNFSTSERITEAMHVNLTMS